MPWHKARWLNTQERLAKVTNNRGAMHKCGTGAGLLSLDGSLLPPKFKCRPAARLCDIPVNRWLQKCRELSFRHGVSLKPSIDSAACQNHLQTPHLITVELTPTSLSPPGLREVGVISSLENFTRAVNSNTPHPW